MKKCTKCKKVKEEKDFQKTYKKLKDGTKTNSFRSNCRECENSRRRESYSKNPATGILSNIKQRCKKKDIPFNLTIEDIVIPEFCPIMEVPLKRGYKDNYDNSPTVDRIIPHKGYIRGNVRVISMMANRLKSNATEEQLKTFYKNIFKYFNDDIV
tara:strand:- start:62 stop:526 length:465 start_codon:yes stop_codon:yes gene_type:complete